MIMADSCFINMIESFYETIQNDIRDNYSKLIICRTLCTAPYLKEFI